MSRWLFKVLKRVRSLAAAHNVQFTLKALRELAGLESGLDQEDACVVQAELSAKDSAGRVASATTGEWMYLFKPQVSGTILYIKLILRNNCVVVSFHEDEDEVDEED